MHAVPENKRVWYAKLVWAYLKLIKLVLQSNKVYTDVNLLPVVIATLKISYYCDVASSLGNNNVKEKQLEFSSFIKLLQQFFTFFKSRMK